MPERAAPHRAGVCCVEAEIDALTGEMQILQTDMHIDFGTSNNPAVDIGQAEGSFVMGLGYYFTEQEIFLEDGQQYSQGTWRYKIPSAYDIPLKMNTKLLDNTPNPNGILNSKCSGEPIICLSSTAYFAVKNAIRAYRASNGNDEFFELPIPATVESIHQACNTGIADFVL